MKRIRKSKEAFGHLAITLSMARSVVWMLLLCWLCSRAQGNLLKSASPAVPREHAGCDSGNDRTTVIRNLLIQKTLTWSATSAAPGLVSTLDYTYDPNGNLASKTDFNGFTTAYQYDANNRLLAKTPDARLLGSGSVAVSFTYTAAGQRASMTDASGTASYHYDNRDRLIEKDTPEGTLFYSYDAQGNVNGIRSGNVNGTSVTYEYDALNRLSAVNDQMLGRTSYGYDAVGNLQGYTYPNGVTTAMQYDFLNRLTNMVSGTVSTPLSRYAYTLGAAGHRLSVSELGGRRVDYNYDPLYRLTGETVTGAPVSGAVAYTYDPVGNRLTRTSSLAGISTAAYAYDADDRLLTDLYDANGNTSTGSVLDSQTGQEVRVSDGYDFENRLISRNNGQVQIVYDGDGNRVAKILNGITTLYLVDDRNPTGYAQVFEELTTTGGPPVVTRVYAYGNDLISQDQVLTDAHGALAWSASFYGYDGHGNVRYLTNPAGAVSDTYDYDAFGILIARSGPTSNDYLYSGEQFDPEVALYFLRARYHNPDTGRFWTMDAMDADSFDLISIHSYLYTQANPVNNIDPAGRMTLTDTEVTAGIAALTGYALYSSTPSGRQFHRQIAAAVSAGIISLVDAARAELTAEDLTVFSTNKKAEKVVDGLLAQAAKHAIKLESFGSGGGPEDPRNHWKTEIKSALQRAKRVVEKRLKNSKQKAEDYLKKIQEIAEKTGVGLD